MSFFNNLFSKSNIEEDDKKLFRLLSLLNHFIEEKKHIYTNPKGERFILTKYGFSPVEQFNLKLQVEDQRRQIDNLERTNKIQNLTIDELRFDLKNIKKSKKVLIQRNIDLLKDKVDLGNLKYKNKLEKSRKGNRSLNAQLIETKKKLKQAQNELATFKTNIAKIVAMNIKKNNNK